MCHCRTELFMTLVIKEKDNVFGLLDWEQMRLYLNYRQSNRELQIVNFECKHLSEPPFCCVLNCTLYCGCRDPVSAQRLACGATVAISGEDLKRNRFEKRNEYWHFCLPDEGLRIPLMWRDSDHFNNRGSQFLTQTCARFAVIDHPVDWLTRLSVDYPGSRRVALFCLLQVGSEVFDTQMMVVDRSVTDVCFEGTNILYVSVVFFFVLNEGVAFAFGCAHFLKLPNPAAVLQQRRSSRVWAEGGAVELLRGGRADAGEHAKETGQEAPQFVWKERWEKALPSAGLSRPRHLPAAQPRPCVGLQSQVPSEYEHIFMCVHGQMCGSKQTLSSRSWNV